MPYNVDRKSFSHYSIGMKVLIFFLILIMNMVSGCTGISSRDNDKLQIAASFYPMAEFTRAVGGEHVEVMIMVPDGVEPHDWEPSPRELTRLGRSQIFVYNGIVEPWAEQALEALSERNIFSVQAGKELYERNGKVDPHVWVSPKRAVVEVQRITDALCRTDEVHAEDYQRNSAKYIAELQYLDKQLVDLGKNSRHKVFITAHAAFGHLASDYGLQQLAIAGISPDAEPTPAALQKLAKVVKDKEIKYIFFETLATPKTAQVLAAETGVQTAVLDPVEGLDKDGREQGLNYIKIMQANIEALKKALAD